MRIALLSDGRNVHTARWAGYFAGQGDEVLLLTLEDPRPMPVPVRRLAAGLPAGALACTLAAPAAARILRRFRPDLVSAHFVPNYGWLAWLTGRRPWALSTWGSDVLVNPHRSAFHRWRARRVLRAADLVTSDAAMLSEAIVALAGEGVRPLTVPMGVDRAIFAAGAGTGPREPVILHDRNLEPVYDVATVLRGAAGFLRVFADWRLRLAGDGAQRASLARLAGELGIAERVDWLGRVPRERLVEELGRAGLYVSASLSDSTSVSLLEAMALGAYPVLSDIPANREWIPAPPRARYFPPGRPEDLTRALLEAVALPETERQSAREANRRRIAEAAIWEDNMATVRAAFARLAEARP
ncbi:MAG: glycosyltransferase [Candidatus Krumholzibacteriota bacterium]|nr:glycosyltransferase [Candidatus Krumholzibacteriota bacterium]